MSTIDQYLAALDSALQDDLVGIEAEARLEVGVTGVMTCLEQVLAGRDVSSRARVSAARRLATLLCELALFGATGDSVRAGIRAVTLFTSANDEEGAARATAITLRLVHPDRARLDDIAVELGGSTTVSTRLKARLKHPELEADDSEIAFLRHTLALLAERSGDLERAFLELLRAVRKAPQVDLYREDTLRLGHAAGKHPELEAVLSELAQRPQLDESQRATLWSQAALLREVHLEDAAAALRAYREALALRPESKAARRHAERLATSLGAEPAPLSAGAAGSVAKESAEDTSVPAAATEIIEPAEPPPGSVPQPRRPKGGAVAPLSSHPVEAAEAPSAKRRLHPVSATAVSPAPTNRSPDTDIDWAPMGVLNSEADPATPESEEGDVFAPLGQATVTRSRPTGATLVAEPAPARKKSRRQKKRENRKRQRAPEPLVPEPTAVDSPSLSPEGTRREQVASASPLVSGGTTGTQGAMPGQPSEPEVVPEGRPDLSARRATEAAEMRAETRVVVSPLRQESAQRPTLEALLAKAEEALAGDDTAACLAVGKQLLEEKSRGAWVLRLSARAMALSKSHPEAVPGAIDLFVEDVPGNGPLALELALELRDGAGAVARRAWLPVWIAVTPFLRDIRAVTELLSPSAEEDAPYGVAFRTLDQLYAAQQLVEERHRLWTDALARTPRDDESRSRAILLGHIRLLEEAGRWTDTLPLLERLTLDVAPSDEMLRRRAITAWETHSTPTELVRLLEKLVERSKGAQAIELLSRVLAQRLLLQDRGGVELAARRLLELRPGDVDAIDALCWLLDGEVSRAGERVDLLLQRFELARRQGNTKSLLPLAEELVTQLDGLGRNEQASLALRAAVLSVPDDEALFGLLSDRLSQHDDHEARLALCTEVAGRTSSAPRKVSLLLMAAEIAHGPLQQHSTAHAFIEQAIALAPDHVAALLARAELAEGLYDATGALAALERLVGKVDEPQARAQVHHRIARIYEEQLLRPEDAARRYRAAIECDPTRIDSHRALLSLAEARGDTAAQWECLLGLSRATRDDERLDALRRLVRLAFDANAGSDRIEYALRLLLEEKPDDEDALEQLITQVASRWVGSGENGSLAGEGTAQIAQELRDVLANAITCARRTGGSLSGNIRRMHAVSLAQQGRVAEAELVLDGLLKEHPSDLETLWGYAELLRLRAELQPESGVRRKQLLETALLHHAPTLSKADQLRLYSEVGALRWQAAEERGAQATFSQALLLVVELDAFSTLSTSLLHDMITALLSYERRAPQQLIDALQEMSRRGSSTEGAGHLEQAARVAIAELKDRNLALELLQQALALNPEADGPRKAMVALELATGNTDNAIGTLQALLSAETDETKKAQIHLQLAELYRSVHRTDAASKQLVRALRLDPASIPLQRAAEEFFHEQRDPRGLEALFSAQLRHIPREHIRGRITLLERLAQVRRYELRDLAGAAEALAAITALDPDSVKAYEDLARVQMELALYPEAAAAWRAVLARDPLYPEAWRSLFSIFARSQQGDEAYAVAASMVAVEIADDAMSKAVRAARPPFPRWPRPRRHAERTKRLLGHPLEASPIRMVMEQIGPALQRVHGRMLSEIGVSKRERLGERQVPSGVLLALRTATQVVGLTELPPLYRWEPDEGRSDENAFRVIPSAEPGLAVSESVLAGGMTPERAFALGRAVAWLMPHALPAATLSAVQLKAELASLMESVLAARDIRDSPLQDARPSARLERELFHGISPQQRDALRTTLQTSLRDYQLVQDQVHLSDWMAGVNYTADRLGFLLCNDLMAAVRCMKASVVSGREHGARLAIKELVLFSISANYLTLRRELHLALPEGGAQPLLDL